MSLALIYLEPETFTSIATYATPRPRRLLISNRDDRRVQGPGHFYGGYKNTMPYGRKNRNKQFNGQKSNQGRVCFACSLLGHVIADCWYTQ